MMTTYDKTNKVVVFVIRKLEICNAQRKYQNIIIFQNIRGRYIDRINCIVLISLEHVYWRYENDV